MREREGPYINWCQMRGEPLWLDTAHSFERIPRTDKDWPCAQPGCPRYTHTVYCDRHYPSLLPQPTPALANEQVSKLFKIASVFDDFDINKRKAVALVFDCMVANLDIYQNRHGLMDITAMKIREYHTNCRGDCEFLTRYACFLYPETELPPRVWPLE